MRQEQILPLAQQNKNRMARVHQAMHNLSLLYDCRNKGENAMAHIPSGVAAEIYSRLQRIMQLVTEVKEIPNFGPDLWTMREGDKKCEQAFQDAKWVFNTAQRYIGTGDGSASGGTGSGGASDWGTGGRTT